MFRLGLTRIEKYSANAVYKKFVFPLQPLKSGSQCNNSKNIRTLSVDSFLVRTPNLYYKRDYCTPITERGVPTHSPTPFERRVLLYSKTFAKDEDIPERVTRSQMKAAKDKFRVVVAIWFMVFWAITTAIIIAWGKSSRSQHIKEEAARVRQQYIDDQRREAEERK